MILAEENGKIGFNKDYSQWVVSKTTLVSKTAIGSVKKVLEGSVKNGNRVVSKTTHTKETNTKERITKEINTKCELGSQVNMVFDIFYKINECINYKNKTNRSAAEFLIKKFGLDGTIKMAEQITACQGRPYCPTATNPYHMKEKLAQFKIYFDREKNKIDKHSVTKIS